MERKENESYLGYARRLTNALEDKTIDYKQFGDLLLGTDNTYSSDNIRKFSYGFKKFLDRLDLSVEPTDVALRQELETLKFETLKERKKLQRINQEYQANARELGDDELYHEMWLDAISKEKPIKVFFTA